jgi:hypothetical protein
MTAPFKQSRPKAFSLPLVDVLSAPPGTVSTVPPSDGFFLISLYSQKMSVGAGYIAAELAGVLNG